MCDLRLNLWTVKEFIGEKKQENLWSEDYRLIQHECNFLMLHA